MNATITFHNQNPGTVWNTLARKLNREPTRVEVSAEIRRILTEGRTEWEGKR